MIASIDDAAERRELVTTATAERLGELRGLIDRLRARSGHVSAAGDPVDTPRETTIEDPRRPAAVAPGAERRGGRIHAAQDPDDDRMPESLADCAPEPPETIPADRTLEVLLSDVGRWATIHGTASTMPLSAVFLMLSGGRKTGCLHLRTTAEHARFVFMDGVIVGVSTSRRSPDERLGDVLVQRNVLTPAQRDELVRSAESERRPLGSVALERGDVSAEDLSGALSAQVQQRFDRVFTDPSAAYAFVPSGPQPIDGSVEVDVRELLFESARRADEAQRHRDEPDPV